MPGGFDFARGAYFQGIGGVGMIPGKPRRVPAPPHAWQLDVVLQLNRLRWMTTRKIVADIQPEFKDGKALGGFAAALVTGHQAFIPKDLTQDMRDSGLAHILSISGVHMAVVGGFIYMSLRFLMALIPAAGLARSGQKSRRWSQHSLHPPLSGGLRGAGSRRAFGGRCLCRVRGHPP